MFSKMSNMTSSIQKQFEESTLTESQVSVLVKWLQKTPETTTIRINLLRTTIDAVKMHMKQIFDKFEYLLNFPSVEHFDSIPEMLLIRSFDENLICIAPRSECKEVIVDVPCASAVLRGAHIYAPGVLAMQTNTKINEIVNIFADIEGACRKGTNYYESSQKLFIGVGQIKMQRFSLFAQDACRGIAVQVHQTISNVPSIGSDYLQDQFGILQNFPSIVCSKVLNPRPNEIVLDMCAAPGNKTTHLAELMGDTGVLIALDKSEKRLIILKDNIKKFGFECVRCYNFNATDALSSTENTSPLSPPFEELTFDKILLDAPCSGLGNRPVLKSTMKKKMRNSFPKVQKNMLDVAVQLLKIGGVLVYSTCSVLEIENELNVAWLLKKYGGKIILETASPIFGGSGLANVGLNDSQRKMVQRFGPNLYDSNQNAAFIDSTGFFISKFRKVA